MQFSQSKTTMTSPSSNGDAGDDTKVNVAVADNKTGSSSTTKKTVAFGGVADEVFPVIPRKCDLTEKEISQLWYISSDLEAAKREIIETLSILRNGRTSSSSFSMKHKSVEVCARGLEMQTDRVRKFDAIRAVNAMFEEQKRQKS